MVQSAELEGAAEHASNCTRGTSLPLPPGREANAGADPGADEWRGPRLPSPRLRKPRLRRWRAMFPVPPTEHLPKKAQELRAPRSRKEEIIIFASGV